MITTHTTLPVFDFQSNTLWSTKSSTEQDNSFTTELLNQFDIKSFMLQDLLLVNTEYSIFHCVYLATNKKLYRIMINQ